MISGYTKSAAIVVFSLAVLGSFQPALAQGNEYAWYGKRFDWVLDIDSKQKNHVDSVNLFIREIGNPGRDTFLVIHGGFGAEHSYLLDALIGIADSAFLIFYDQRGSLRSRCGESVISLQTHVSDIERIRKAYRASRFNIIAHSMGTLLAMEYTKTYPRNAGKLILMGAIPARVASVDSFWNTIGAPLDMSDTVKVNAMRREWRQALNQANVSRDQYLKTDSLRTANYMSMSTYFRLRHFWAARVNIGDLSKWKQVSSTYGYNAEAGAAVWSNSQIKSWDYVTQLNNHTYPVHILHGTKDFISVNLHKDLFRSSRNVKIIEFTGSGHNLWVESKDRFKAQMLATIKR